MALSLLSNMKDPNKIECLEIGTFEIDVTLTEQHEFMNTISNYPIEDGTSISDMVKQQPYKLKLTGLTSNTPISFLGGKLGDKLIRQDLTNKSQVAFNKLLQMAGYAIPKVGTQDPIKNTSVKLLTIFTGLLVYRDMIITNISFTRDKSTGESLPYSIDFQNVKKVKSSFSVQNIKPIQNVDKQAQNNVDKGKVSPEKTNVQKEKSFLFKAKESIDNIISKKNIESGNTFSPGNLRGITQ